MSRTRGVTGGLTGHPQMRRTDMTDVQLPGDEPMPEPDRSPDASPDDDQQAATAALIAAWAAEAEGVTDGR